MISLQMAQECGMFYHVRIRNADGTALRCRSNGVCHTLKSRPGKFSLPVKHGMWNCFYIMDTNAADWMCFDITVVAALAKLHHQAPLEAIYDRLVEFGHEEAAKDVAAELALRAKV